MVRPVRENEAEQVDVHQHLWPAELVEQLRSRRIPPLLDGWTLRLSGEPDFAVDPADHDPVRRAALAAADGTGRALVSLSSPLGIEHLPAADAAPLLDAYHAGSARLGPPFGAWAAASVDAPRAGDLERLLAAGFVGLQLPATALADAAGYRRCAALLEVLEAAERPLLIHPGPLPPPATTAGSQPEPVPGWWPAVVTYVGQMHAAWYAFRAFGRPAHPRLRVCFAMLAGLAPLHAERAANRGAADLAGPDPLVWLETSSYGGGAISALARAYGAEALVRGSDRPYAAPPDPGLGAAAADLIGVANPARLLGADNRPVGGS